MNKRQSVPIAVLIVVALSAGFYFRSQIKIAGLITRSYVSHALNRRSKPHFRVASIQGTGSTRLYLIHGMKNDHHQWDLTPFNLLKKHGEQIVLIDLPTPTPDFFNDRGKAYCAAFIQWMRDTDASLDAKLGKPQRKAVAGISYGGFHAIVAAANIPQIETYAALSPVTDLSFLPEFRWQSNASCSPLTSPAKKRGIFAYSLDDQRVNAKLIALAARSANARQLVTNGYGHSTSRAQAEALIDFLP